MTQLSLLILDRDGVINVDRATSVTAMDQFAFVDRSCCAFEVLNNVAQSIVVATNQACLGRGQIQRKMLDQIHRYMCQEIERCGGRIDQIYVCPAEDPQHPDRKPNPGMLLRALEDWGASAGTSLFVGDDLRDFQASQAAGIPFALVLTGKGRDTHDLLFGTSKKHEGCHYRPLPASWRSCSGKGSANPAEILVAPDLYHLAQFTGAFKRVSEASEPL